MRRVIKNRMTEKLMPCPKCRAEGDDLEMVHYDHQLQPKERDLLVTCLRCGWTVSYHNVNDLNFLVTMWNASRWSDEGQRNV